MKLVVTIVKVLDDEDWGFSDLLNGRPLNEETKQEIIELLHEDISEVLDAASIFIAPYLLTEYKKDNP